MFRIICMLLLFCSFTQGFIFSSLFKSQKKCYKPYGCFKHKKPFTNAVGNVPDSPKKQGIQFFLYTDFQQEEPETIRPLDHSSIKQSTLKPKTKTVCIIHGLSGSGNDYWVTQMKDELLEQEDLNIVIVHWRKGAAVNYFQAVANTRIVGAVAAQLINDLHSVGQIAFSQYHVIGHSLGAHIAGYIGQRVDGLGRITGLDPAGPAFKNTKIEVRLDTSDAKYVDIIHTDDGALRDLAFGMKKAIGHADFYPNGGKKQPGCSRPNAFKYFTKIMTGKLGELTKQIACSHMRAIDYFTNSINTCVFKAHHCDSDSNNVIMGYHSPSNLRGKFCLKTTDKEPFCVSIYNS